LIISFGIDTSTDANASLAASAARADPAGEGGYARIFHGQMISLYQFVHNGRRISWTFEIYFHTPGIALLLTTKSNWVPDRLMRKDRQYDACNAEGVIKTAFGGVRRSFPFCINA